MGLLQLKSKFFLGSGKRCTVFIRSGNKSFTDPGAEYKHLQTQTKVVTSQNV